MTYQQLLNELFECADEKYRAFHSRLLKNEKIVLIGVRTPLLRAMARKFVGEFWQIVSFPDEYYEVTFLKCAMAGLLSYEEYCRAAQILVPKLDNWATCDCFKNGDVKKHRAEFLPTVRAWLADGREFVVRYGLVTLLSEYMTEEYLEEIFTAVRAQTDGQYYVSMACAWLVAETLVHFFDEGVAFLREGSLSRSTHNRAIGKARESFRLTDAQKELLKNLKK